ncbi:hypothetical protein B0T26DRAFT_296722 [Lasiosphaeria miniovina]|uniref:Uncharacterized protein n=1 Tax=Lasiosphaeria miniovina TaxID=1954250 RepID=A0AA40AKA5_9PEZI|nr:uncharacterized protein B0T26DRAFT_296722 [Lasiosphaeria miniovina]KAK0717428.1 hypothetical protein B0T26DRAFT_296722 [Lasiosphaeria miniovina]
MLHIWSGSTTSPARCLLHAYGWFLLRYGPMSWGVTPQAGAGVMHDPSNGAQPWSLRYPRHAAACIPGTPRVARFLGRGGIPPKLGNKPLTCWRLLRI